jgi:hypothetical protein
VTRDDRFLLGTIVTKIDHLTVIAEHNREDNDNRATIEFKLWGPGGGGGGGGSGYAVVTIPINGVTVTINSSTLTSGSGATPGNSGDSDRAGLGDGGGTNTAGDNGILLYRVNDGSWTSVNYSGATESLTLLAA